MSEKRQSYSGGVGLGGAVFLVFLVLKLTGTGAVADWSWWWVTSPLWGTAALAAAIFVALFAIFYVGHVVDKLQAHRRNKRGR